MMRHLWLLLLTATLGFNDDLFNYGESDLDNRNYGPLDWDQVTCDDVTTCVSSLFCSSVEKVSLFHPPRMILTLTTPIADWLARWLGNSTGLDIGRE